MNTCTRATTAVFFARIISCKNITLPLGHIVLLEQAPLCAVKEISAREKLRRLLCECSFSLQDPGQYDKMMELVPDLLNHVPVIAYGCTKGPEAVDTLEVCL